MRHHTTLLADAVRAAGTQSSRVEDHTQLPLTARALRLALQLMLEVTRFLEFLTQSSVNEIRIAHKHLPFQCMSAIKLVAE